MKAVIFLLRSVVVSPGILAFAVFVCVGCQESTEPAKSHFKDLRARDVRGSDAQLPQKTETPTGPPTPRKIYTQETVFSPSGSILLTLDTESNIYLWDIVKKKQIWKGRVELAQVAQFFADGRRIALGCINGPVLIWDVEKKETLAKLEGHDQNVTKLAISPDQRRLVSAGTFAQEGAEVMVWDVEMKRLEKALRGSPQSLPLCMRIMDDGKRLLLLGTIEGKQQTVLDEFSPDAKNTLNPRFGLPRLRAAQFLPNGNQFVGSLWSPLEACLFSIPEMKRVVVFGRYDADPGAFALSPDGSTVLITDGKVVVLWTVNPPGPKWTAKIPMGTGRVAAFSLDGKLAAIGGGFDVGRYPANPVLVAPTVFLFDVSSGKLLFTLQGD